MSDAACNKLTPVSSLYEFGYAHGYDGHNKCIEFSKRKEYWEYLTGFYDGQRDKSKSIRDGREVNE